MRKLLPALALLAAFGFGAAPASGESISPPPEAKAWLGTWQTNQGEFRFSKLSDCQNRPPSEGIPSCQLDGEWDTPGGRWATIYGYVFLGPKYKGEAWQGCVPNATFTSPGMRCGFNTQTSLDDVSIDRLGEKFTDGFWRDCPLEHPCSLHHPIVGKKLNGPPPSCRRPPRFAADAVPHAAVCVVYKVPFAFLVDGFPDSPPDTDLPPALATVELKTVATRLIFNPGAMDFAWHPGGTIEMTTTYVSAHAAPHIHEFHITIEPFRARYGQSAVRRIVQLEATVEKSDDQRCRTGQDVSIRFGIKGSKAAVELSGIGGHGCLGKRPLIWAPHRIKIAYIKPYPQP
jgi:hypothetical protein